MAEIIGENFKLVQASGTFYDLYKKVKVNEGKENQREEYIIVGYGMPLKTCIVTIITWFIEDKEYNLLEYLIAFEKASDKLYNIIINEKDNSR